MLKCPPKLGEMKALTEVNLAANKIMQVPPGALAGWVEMTVLNWQDNRILKLAPLGHMQACSAPAGLPCSTSITATLSTSIGTTWSTSSTAAATFIAAPSPRLQSASIASNLG